MRKWFINEGEKTWIGPFKVKDDAEAYLLQNHKIAFLTLDKEGEKLLSDLNNKGKVTWIKLNEVI